MSRLPNDETVKKIANVVVRDFKGHEDAEKRPRATAQVGAGVIH